MTTFVCKLPVEFEQVVFEEVEQTAENIKQYTVNWSEFWVNVRPI